MLQDNIVHFSNQPIGVVVADTLERATHAATLVRVSYDKETPATSVEDEMARAFPASEAKDSEGETGKAFDKTRGNPQAIAQAEVRLEHTYTIPREHHNPIEAHATIAVWQGRRLTLYDKTQWVSNVRSSVALTFGMPEENVRVISPFVGGAFGSALRTWPHVIVAAIAAQRVRRPVKLVLTREQMYTSVGCRPYTVQRVELGATKEGKLCAIVHESTAQTSPYEEFTESTLNVTRHLYACPNVVLQYRLVHLNVNTPTYMRGPGEVSGAYALESAMDELAYALKIDPVELRLRNHADVNPNDGLPYSSKSLKECYRQGAERFGWDRRNPEPTRSATGSTSSVGGWRVQLTQ